MRLRLRVALTTAVVIAGMVALLRLPIAMTESVWVVPAAAVVIAVVLGIEPVVRRVRRLTEAVELSASAGYTGRVTLAGRDEVAELARAFDAASREVRIQLA